MNPFTTGAPRLLGLLFIPLLLALWPAAAPSHAVQTTQSLTLEPGWNSIWLEVEPRHASGTNAGEALSVEEVFSDEAITLVATPHQPVGTAEFLTDAETLRFNQAGWRVWRRASEVRGSTLAAVAGHQGYLVHVSGTRSVALDITGDALFKLPRWQADSYNLKGFGLAESVTFSEFFKAGTVRHPLQRMFRLEASGDWVAVRGSDLMESGEAYWIYSDGPSSFHGPVQAGLIASGGIDFQEGPPTLELPDPQSTSGGTLFVNLHELRFHNVSDTAQIVTLRKILPATSGVDALADDLRLYEVAPRIDELGYDIGPNGQIVETSIELASGSTRTVSLGAYRAWTSGEAVRENLYRIELGNVYFWLPVSASSLDISPGTSLPADSSYAGLWVGEAVLNEVTSATEAGRPLQPASSKAPLRLIIHVGADGIASFLSHVMIMQTRTEDGLPGGEQVLVVDEFKIPYFEGIERRGDKTAGKRIETTGYDLPRKMDLATQAVLVSDTAAALGITTDAVTEDDIQTYVNGQASRPVSLVDDYHLSWPLEGGFGPGALVQTAADKPLSLDPFHRSNPFRHAFHPKHGAGYAISRTITLRLSHGTGTGILLGTYEETISGLAAFSLEARGSLVLQRLSKVSTLE